ncbi:MAG: hypothetical protein ACMZ7B_13380 [Balneola sp.]
MKFIWGFNGIALSILLIISIPRIFYELIDNNFGINNGPHERGIIVGDKSERANELNVDLQHLMYERPIKIDSSNFYYSPVVVLDKKLPQDIIDDINSASDISIYMVGAAINIIFFNEDRSQIQRLLPKNGYIHNYLIGGERYSYYRNDQKNFPFGIYQIALSDDNGDSRINEKDNMPFFLSNLDGTKLRKITPDTLKLDSYWFSDNFNEIYFDEVIEDKESPLIRKGYFEKTRKVYYYNLITNEFKLFDELQNEFNNIQKNFKN